MKYAVEKQEKYAVFSLNEENLNHLVAPKLKSEFVILHNEGIGNLILDLANVRYIDSSGLSAILTGNRLWSDVGVFVLTGLNHPAVKKLLEISRLDSVLTIVPSAEESVDYVIMSELERELQADSDVEESN